MDAYYDKIVRYSMMKRLSPYLCICWLVFVTFHGQQVCVAYQSTHFLYNFDSYHTPAADLPDDRQLVIPRRVRSDGSFVSHQIPHYFERTSHRNQTASDNFVHYRLHIDHEEYHIELYPNDQLIGPGAVVEERRDSQKFLDSMRLKRLHDMQCHYRARVRNQTGNSALSTCYGLVGYIKTKHAWYMIEPVAGHNLTKKTEQPHIVYKRSPDEFQTSEIARDLCNVVDDTSRIIAKRALNPRKRVFAKRNESKPYTVELLVVLDKTLLNHHREFDIENYVLTLFNIAAGLFHDASLGMHVQLTIVRIIRLEVEEDEMNLSINRDADTTLRHFQEWQRTMNPGDDTHPNHHDCAILISKLDICVSRSLCGFTGTSTIAGTCDPLRGAVIVRDAGLPTGYHIAHQIGHTLGMSHDVARENGCPGIVHHGDEYVEVTVMHPGDMYITKKWSECSRRYLSSYIEQGLAFCLEDEPQDHHFPAIEMLPGVMYNGDDQCRLRYRPDARQCDMGITCEALRCAIPGRGCVSERKPPAEGTPCGEKRWCYQMKCLMIGERPGVIDGGWGTWSPWSRCSRTCGSGVAYAIRRCDRPSPSGGGVYCIGERKRHKICATNPCEISASSFRDVQCAEFNDWVFPEDGKVHRWMAYNLPEDLRTSENPCALYCVSETNLVTSLRPKVVDGTTCYRGIRDICVGGVCREIPCDLNMESNAVEDVCGVCRGDSTSCMLKQGTASFSVQHWLRKVTDVPAGSRNIRVEETEPTKSRIVVRTKSTKTVLIDGNRLGMFDVPGSKAWLGMIRPRQEALNIPGPVTEDLVILVLPKENVTLKYSLGLKQRTPRRSVFLWDFIDWEKCSAGCGPGEQTSKPHCIEKIGGLVDDKFCRNISKPDAKVRPCNQAPCIPRWIIGDWQGCAPCTPGCERTRAVKCVRPVGRGEQDVDVIEDSHCQGPKPRETEPCEVARRRREDGSGGKRRHIFSASARSSALTRQNDFIEAAGGSVKMALNSDGDVAEDRRSSSRLSRARRIGDVCDSSNSINTGDVNALPNVTVNLIPPDGSTRDSYEIRRSDRSQMDKRSNDGSDNRQNDRRVERTDRIKKGELVIDKEGTRNLTLTIILERDERNAVVNFPRDFQPRPPENGTEFTLIGMDALRYIQRIQEEARGAFRERRV
ncbi:A disintegrin and metalloproteinase with thrombospondin motifs 7 [Ooceraea biroi]|uniref:A disintegrin and metalloproteinase with thrombospondin motifs 7 n=1 Tax=Ooceraea biroi TaxID=2015173 RepID=UPI000F0866EE|nr:A disintegrin and metalloproteinase with thrombospondin motifs 7 [Ooceraea biroi]